MKKFQFAQVVLNAIRRASAGKKGRAWSKWVILGLFFGSFVLIIIAVRKTSSDYDMTKQVVKEMDNEDNLRNNSQPVWGRVLDFQNKPISGVHILLRDYIVEKSVISDEYGVFAFQLLTIERRKVELEFRKKGYKNSKLLVFSGNQNVKAFLEREN